jgi:hypothetical protein
MEGKAQPRLLFRNAYQKVIERPVPFIVLFFFLLGIGRIIGADFYAEEGSIFLPQAFSHSFSSLLIPYAGYFHTLPRIIALAGTFLPLATIPYFFTITCFLIAGLVFSSITSDDYNWLIHKRSHRVLLALFFCLAPGLREIAGNLTNLHWILLLLLGLLSIKDLSSRYSYFDYIMIFLSIFSEGASLIFLPVFILRFAFHLKDRDKHVLLQDAYPILLLVISVALNFSVRVKATNVDLGVIQVVLYFEYLLRFIVMFPLVGDAGVSLLAKQLFPLIFCSTLVLGLMTLVYYRKFRKEHLLFLIFLACGLTLIPLISMARAENVSFIQTQASFTKYWYSHRYSFFCPILGWFLWVFVGQYACWRGKNISKKIFLLIAVIAVLGSWHRIIIHSYGTRHDWKKKVAKIESCLKKGHPSIVLVNIYPKGWLMKITPQNVSTEPQSVENPDNKIR